MRYFIGYLLIGGSFKHCFALNLGLKLELVTEAKTKALYSNMDIILSSMFTLRIIPMALSSRDKWGALM